MTHTEHIVFRIHGVGFNVQRGDNLGRWSSADGVESFVGRTASTNFSTWQSATKVSAFLEVVVLLNNATVYGIYRYEVDTVWEGWK